MKTQKVYPVFVLFVFLSLLVSACGTSSTNSVDGQPSGTIAISGAFALYPMMTRWAEEFQKINPDVLFDISAGGAGKGMTDAVSGAVDIGMVSREIRPEEESLGAYGVAVTKDAVFPVVNANNPAAAEILAQGISQETFIKIYVTGEIKTWGEVVGNPAITEEIHVFTRSDAAGAPEMWAMFTGDNETGRPARHRS